MKVVVGNPTKNSVIVRWFAANPVLLPSQTHLAHKGSR